VGVAERQVPVQACALPGARRGAGEQGPPDPVRRVVTVASTLEGRLPVEVELLAGDDPVIARREDGDAPGL
jgi:hypothetical protein